MDVWARREAVLIAALIAAASVVALGEAVGVTWLRVVGLAVGAVGGVGRLVIAWRGAKLKKRQAERETERESAERERWVRVSRAPVASVDPTLIGVDLAVQTLLEGAAVPEYVPRTVDDELERAVRAAAEGRGPWIVVVHGPAKVGKSRSLFHALATCPQTRGLELVAPRGPKELESLLAPGQQPESGDGGAVLWLDDLEPFLNGGVTLQTLRDWQAGKPRRIVAGTLGGKGSERIAGSRLSRLATIADEVLQHAEEVALQATTAAEENPASLPPIESRTALSVFPAISSFCGRPPGMYGGLFWYWPTERTCSVRAPEQATNVSDALRLRATRYG